LLRCLAGLESLDSGKIFFKGQDITHPLSHDLRHKTGLIFQGYSLLLRLNIIDNILLPVRLCGFDIKNYQEKARDLLKLVGLENKAYSYPAQLSGGQRQRVAIARALILDPELLLCDEITSALDPEMVQEILSLLKDLNRSLSLTVILVTHDLSVVRSIVDHVCVIDQGTLIESGRTIDVLRHPQHHITQAMVESFYQTQIPSYWTHRIHSRAESGDDVVYRLDFGKQSSTQPIVSHLAMTFGLPINIISGNIDHIDDESLGHLIIAFPYQEHNLSSMLRFFEEKDVRVQCMGYLRWN
jgi:D-methionine transport system ATP-binding protein